MKVCIVVPYYDHLAQFRQFLPELLQTGVPLLVVDDASPADDGSALAELLAVQAPGSILLRHETNGGKGAAVMTALRTAFAEGFTHAVQIDADGQHDIADLSALLGASGQQPDCLVCGKPQFGTDISGLRYFARYITLCLVWLETLGTEIRDALCGFRVYPLQQTVELLDRCEPGRRMAFDPEILVRAVWADIGLCFVPVHVCYPDSGRSHFRYIRDNAEIAWMHTRLISGMLPRIPALLRRRARVGREVRS